MQIDRAISVLCSACRRVRERETPETNKAGIKYIFASLLPHIAVSIARVYVYAFRFLSLAAENCHRQFSTESKFVCQWINDCTHTHLAYACNAMTNMADNSFGFDLEISANSNLLSIENVTHVIVCSGFQSSSESILRQSQLPLHLRAIYLRNFFRVCVITQAATCLEEKKDAMIGLDVHISE